MRARKLAALSFPEEVRENVTIQADLYVEALQNKCIRQDIIKEAPIKLLVAIALARDSQRIWEKVEGSRTQV